MKPAADSSHSQIIIIIIMEICKAPTLRLKAPNKHTHIMYNRPVSVGANSMRPKTAHSLCPEEGQKLIKQIINISQLTPLVTT